MKIDKLPSINGLRALSIIIVILHHLSMKYKIFTYIDVYEWPVPFTKLLHDGDFGVNVFFVISGFLITTLLLAEEAKTQTISFKNFYIRRTLRIFPAYYFLLLVYFILQLTDNISLSNESWLSSITYTKYFNWQLDWFTAHGWSLSIEEHFYLFWPFVFLVGPKFRKIFAIFLVLIVPVIRVVTYYHPVDMVNELTIFTRIDSIALGCFFALYKDAILNKIEKYLTVLFFVSIAVLILLPYLPPIAIKVNIYLFMLFIAFGVTQGFFANLCIAFILMYSMYGPQRIWYKFLNLKVMNYIGMLSYSIYLWQQFFIYESPYWYNQYPFNLIYIAVAALLSYYLIEKPFLKLKTKF
jgi:peptidoglycan/LPS O-acetylase OafA/YrhL